MRSRVGLWVGGRTVDVAIPAGVPVYDVLREIGVDLDASHLTVVDSAGRLVDRYSTTGDQLVDGAVLHVVSTASPRRSAAARGADDVDPATARPSTSAWWLGVAGVAAVVLVVTAVADLVGGERALGQGDRLGLAAALGVVSLALAAVLGRPGVVGSAWPAAVAGLTGAAAGVLAVDPAIVGAGRLMVVAGLVGAMVPVAARWASGRRAGDEVADVAAVLLAVLVVAVVLTALALLMDLPAVLPAAALLGAVPVCLRALPSLCVDVPDTQLVDVSLVERTASAVRAPVTEPLGAVNERMVSRTVQSAERRRDAGTLVLSLLAPVLAPVVLAAPEPGLTRVATITACLMVVLALSLGPRGARGGLLHWVPRTAGLILLVEVTALGVGGDAGTMSGALLVLAALGVGLGAAALSLPIGRGWRSVGFSRLADAVEGLATVLALPVALVGAGTVEALRALVT